MTSTGIDELRDLVTAFNACREDFNTEFTTEQLLQLWRMWLATEADVYPDEWTAAQVTAALAGVVPRWDAQEHPIAQEIPTGPQSCYPVEIATLRELLDEQRGILPLLQQKRAEGKRLASVVWAIAKCEQRIEALQTAIEALGGAL